MTAPVERRKRNAQVAASLDEHAWATVFLTAFRENRLPGFEIPQEANPLTEINTIYGRVPEDVRSVMKAAIGRAIGEFNRRLYEFTVLRGLAWTAASLRATESVPGLVHHTIALSPNLGRDDTPEFVAAEELISVLASFAPHPRVEFLFRNLLFDDTVHFRLAGLLAIGLVRCDPTRFVSALNRYVQRRADGPRFFNDRSVMRGFFESLPRAEIETSLPLLDPFARPLVIEWADHLGIRIAWASFPPEEFIDADAPATPAMKDFDSWNDTYDRARGPAHLDILYRKVAELPDVTH